MGAANHFIFYLTKCIIVYSSNNNMVWSRMWDRFHYWISKGYRRHHSEMNLFLSSNNHYSSPLIHPVQHFQRTLYQFRGFKPQQQIMNFILCLCSLLQMCLLILFLILGEYTSQVMDSVIVLNGIFQNSSRGKNHLQWNSVLLQHCFC